MGENRSVSDKAITPLEYLDQLCDYAMSLGMPYSEYWNGDYDILNHYVNAEQIRQKKRNMELWLQGAYVYQAIGNLVPILNPFSKEHKAKPYPKEPFPLTQQEIDERRQKKIQRWVDYMMKKVKKMED